MEKGTLTGHPMVDIKVTLYDGKAHSVDSSDMAFQSAGALALKEASNPSTVALLEPLDEVSVTVNDEYLGAVMTDLSNRRGQVLGTDSSGSGKSTVNALVPQSELSRYAIDLRGLARGSGAFSRKFHGYEVMPTNLAQRVQRPEAASASRRPVIRRASSSMASDPPCLAGRNQQVMYRARGSSGRSTPCRTGAVTGIIIMLTGVRDPDDGDRLGERGDEMDDDQQPTHRDEPDDVHDREPARLPASSPRGCRRATARNGHPERGDADRDSDDQQAAMTPATK